jgi:capsule polysaccharide export protein KpsE/RkpR
VYYYYAGKSFEFVLKKKGEITMTLSDDLKAKLATLDAAIAAAAARVLAGQQLQLTQADVDAINASLDAEVTAVNAIAPSGT